MGTIYPPPDFTFDIYESRASAGDLTAITATPPIVYNTSTFNISDTPATALVNGYVTTGAQTFAGTKIFNAVPQTPIAPTLPNDLCNLAYVGTGVGTITATLPVLYNPSTYVISEQAASATTSGHVTTGAQQIEGTKTFIDGTTEFQSGAASLNTSTIVVDGTGNTTLTAPGKITIDNTSLPNDIDIDAGNTLNLDAPTAITITTSNGGIALQSTGGGITGDITMSSINDLSITSTKVGGGSISANPGAGGNGYLSQDWNFLTIAPTCAFDPTTANSLTRRSWVQSLITPTNYKNTCKVASYTTLPNSPAYLGTPNFTLTATTFGSLIIDLYAPSLGERALIKNQAVPSHNGIYTVTNAGSGSTYWQLTRATDYDASGEITFGDIVYVNYGAASLGYRDNMSWIMDNQSFTTLDGGGAAGQITWNNTNTVYPRICTVKDIKSAGTEGGTATSGSWFTRTINTVSGDSSVLVGGVITANTFTLVAGYYFINGTVPAYKLDRGPARLYNTTDAAVTINGSCAWSDNGDFTQDSSFINGGFTIAGTKTFRIEQRVSNTRSTDGLGRMANLGDPEVYTQLTITQFS